MSEFVAEIIGTAILIILGGGVCANVLLKNTKANSSGWIVVTFGWAMGVFVAVFTVSQFSGAHINPAVTIGLAVAHKFAWANVPKYLLAQLIGGCIGAFIVWVHYRQHFEITEDKAAKLCVFCTTPQERNYVDNVLSEIIGTFILVFGVIYMATPDVGLGAIQALPVAFLVFAIGLSLGGTTGYAINPARDLAPRIMHAILPFSKKGSSDWKYAWVPVVGPVVGGSLAGLLYIILQ